MSNLQKILVVIILAAIFEVFVAPKSEKIKDKYADDDNVTVYVINGNVAGIKPGQLAAAAALEIYWDSDDSYLPLIENVYTSVTIGYKVKNDNDDNVYEAIVIYFDSISDANKARKGVKNKIKDADKVAMFRGKTLVLGDEKAVLKYYSVFF